MVPNTESSVLTLHQGKEHVWSALNNLEPAGHPLTPEDYVSQMKNDFDCVRLIGHAVNARLILALAARFADKLQLACPRACRYREDLEPTITILQCRQCLLSPGLGGWRRYTVGDAATWRLAVLLADENTSDADMVAAATLHPVYRKLRFIPTLNPLYVARLIVAVGDPRGFLDAEHTSRTTQLNVFLGLDPQIMPRCRRGDSDKHKRALTTLLAWQSCWNVSESERLLPANWLWRVMYHHDERSRGELIASQRFAEFFWWVWMEHIHGQDWRVPANKLLALEKEQEAYADFCNNLPNDNQSVVAQPAG